MQEPERARTRGEPPKISSAPPAWHQAVNVPAAMLWMLGLPLLACHLLSLSLGWALVLVSAWSVLTGRVADRGLPALTGPLVDRLYRAVRRG